MNVIIFDMDGTLVDSGKAIAVTINDMRKKVGLKSDLEEKFIIEVINDPNADYISAFYPNVKVTKELMSEFEIEFRKNYDLYAKIYDGVDEFLNNLKKDDFFIALASNAPKNSLEDILAKNKIYSYFDFIIGSNNEIPKKPDPTMLLEVLKKANNSQKSLFIGDSYKDMLAAKNANIPYLQVTWGFGLDMDEQDNVKTVEEAYKYILTLFYDK